MARSARITQRFKITHSYGNYIAKYSGINTKVLLINYLANYIISHL